MRKQAKRVDWQAVRRDYEGREITIGELLALHGITHHQLRTRREAELWSTRRRPTITRAGLTKRMLRLFDTHLEALERTALDAADKDITALLAAGRTLEKLLKMQGPEIETDTSSEDPYTVRFELVRRLIEYRSR